MRDALLDVDVHLLVLGGVLAVGADGGGRLLDRLPRRCRCHLHLLLLPCVEESSSRVERHRPAADGGRLAVVERLEAWPRRRTRGRGEHARGVVPVLSTEEQQIELLQV
jgi:hypothetical protein